MSKIRNLVINYFNMFGSLSDFKKSLYLNIGLIVGTVIVLGAFYFLIRLNITHQVKIIEDINSKKAYVSKSAENLASLIKDLPTARNYLGKISNLVPSHDYLVSSFLIDINKIARQNDVLLSFVFGAESPASGNQKGSIAFLATIDGKVDSVISFLKDVESRYFSLRIDSLDISRPNQDVIRVSASGRIFFSSK